MNIGLSLGSNKGDRAENLRDARTRIKAMDGVNMVSQSALYETEPYDVPEKYREIYFLNTVLIVDTELDVLDFFMKLKEIESELGRLDTEERNAPRTMDIDVIYAEKLERDEAPLVIPHPRWADRRFVVQPLADLDPAMRLPRCQTDVSEVLAGLPERPTVSLYQETW